MDPDVVSFTVNCEPAFVEPKSAIKFCVFEPLCEPVNVAFTYNAVCVWFGALFENEGVIDTW